MIFLDTSGIYAVIDGVDPVHTRAARTFAALIQSEERLVTTNYVATELIALTQRRLGLDVVKAVARALLAGIDIGFSDQSLDQAAMDLLLAENRRQLSFIDCSSIVYMRRNGITRVFAFDSDFARFGFEVL